MAGQEQTKDTYDTTDLALAAYMMAHVVAYPVPSAVSSGARK